MANDSVIGNQNVYYRCRKEAAKYNDNLNSRGNAAELIGISESSLSDYELGLTKVVPVDKVVLMSELYNAPQLKTLYCKKECPIGRDLPLATEVKSVEKIAIKLLMMMDITKVNEIKKAIIEIAEDGIIDETELVRLEEIREYLDTLAKIFSELRLLCDKCSKEV